MDKKLCVYAICKNESKFIDRWVASIKDEADYIVVLDTGSTDNSVELLKKYEPQVRVVQYDYLKEEGEFRFDRARNDSMKLIPFDTDICVILDLDHVPRAGWSELIKRRFEEGYNLVYGYIIDHSQGEDNLDQWMSKNVHSYSPFWIWDKMIHEGIDWYGDESEVNSIMEENFIIDHYPDESKDRTLYRELLEVACNENPDDPYYGIYLGVELSRRYSREEAAEAFRKCLNECNFEDNKDLKYQTLINLANYSDDKDEILQSLLRAKNIGIDSGISSRRLAVALADLYESMGDKDKAIEELEGALHISYSNDWRDDVKYFGSYLEDRLSLFYYYHKQDYQKAYEYGLKALELDPDNERIKTNLRFYEEKIK